MSFLNFFFWFSFFLVGSFQSHFTSSLPPSLFFYKIYFLHISLPPSLSLYSTNFFVIFPPCLSSSKFLTNIPQRFFLPPSLPPSLSLSLYSLSLSLYLSSPLSLSLLVHILLSQFLSPSTPLLLSHLNFPLSPLIIPFHQLPIKFLPLLLYFLLQIVYFPYVWVSLFHTLSCDETRPRGHRFHAVSRQK